jgi:endo-1,4-beta-xylanase
MSLDLRYHPPTESNTTSQALRLLPDFLYTKDFTMFFTKAIIAASIAASGVVAAPSLFERQQGTPNEEGTHDGYFFSWWSDGASPATYTNGAGGSYSVEWQSGGNLVGGKGWNPGSAR